MKLISTSILVFFYAPIIFGQTTHYMFDSLTIDVPLQRNNFELSYSQQRGRILDFIVTDCGTILFIDEDGTKVLKLLNKENLVVRKKVLYKAGERILMSRPFFFEKNNGETYFGPLNYEYYLIDICSNVIKKSKKTYPVGLFKDGISTQLKFDSFEETTFISRVFYNESKRINETQILKVNGSGVTDTLYRNKIDKEVLILSDIPIEFYFTEQEVESILFYDRFINTAFLYKERILDSYNFGDTMFNTSFSMNSLHYDNVKRSYYFIERNFKDKSSSLYLITLTQGQINFTLQHSFDFVLLKSYINSGLLFTAFIIEEQNTTGIYKLSLNHD